MQNPDPKSSGMPATGMGPTDAGCSPPGRPRQPFPPALLARIREVGATCILAGCDADETIAAVKLAVERWDGAR